MKIYNNSNQLIKDVTGATAALSNVLMGDNTVTLSYESTELTVYPVGAYIDTPEGRYYLCDEYRPNDSATGYDYQIPFRHFTALFEQSEFYFEDATGTRQYYWTISANLDTLAELVNTAIQRDFPTLGVTIGAVKANTENIDVTFEGYNLLEAISTIANAFETEWWAYGKELNFDFALFNVDSPLVLQHGVNIGDTITASYPDVQYQYVRAFGGTTNMPLDSESLVSYMPRVPMPEGSEVIAVKGINTGRTKTLLFDDIFPLMDGEITAVKYNGDDENPIYYIKTDMGHDIESVKAAGKVPSIRFTSGILNGRDFEVDDTTIDGAKWVEIFRTENDGIFIPRPLLDPRVGDTFLMENVTVAPEAITEASNRLLAEVQKEVETMAAATPDISGVETSAAAFLANPYTFKIGEAVTIKHPTLPGNGVTSRVTSISYSFDAPESVTLGFSDKATQGTLASLEDQVKTVTVNLDTYKASNTNDTRYVRKDIDDVVRGVLSMRKGLISVDFLSGLLGAGFSISEDSNGKWHLEIDEITARQKLNVYELVSNIVTAINGEQVISQANGIVRAVEELGDNYVLTFDGAYFKVGDFIKAQDFSANTYYHTEVTAVDGVAITIGKADTNSVPKVDDNVVQIGNKSDVTRQSAIMLSAVKGREGLRIYQGINSKDYEGKLLSAYGYLGDINDPLFPDMADYGLYLKGSVYLAPLAELSTKVDEVDSKIDNLEIGGINLANQSFGKTSGAYFTYNGEVTDDVAPSGQVSLSYTKIGAGNPYIVGYTYGAAKAGDTLTVSMWVKSSAAGARLTFYQAGSPIYRKDKLSTKANEWERLIFTHTMERDLTNLIIYGYLPAVDGAEVLISSFQVERGSKATDFKLSEAAQKAVNESYTDNAIADSEAKVDYLKEAIQEGATSEVKGVALAELMVVREGDTTEDVRAGMSGIKDDGVAFFAGESDAYNKAVTFITDLRSDTLEKKAEFPNFLVDDAGQSYVKRMLVQGGSQTPFYFIDSADDVVDLGVFSNVILEKEGYKATLVYPSEGVDNGVVINIINNSYGDYAPVKYESFNFYEGLSDGYLRLKVLKNQQVTLTGFAVGYLSRVNKLAGYAVTRQMIGGSFTLNNKDYQTDVVEANTMVSPNGQITQWGQVTMEGARQRVYVNSTASRFPIDKSQVSIIMTPYSLDGIPRTYEIVDIQSTWFDMVARDARTGAEIAGKFSWVAYHPRG